MNGVRSFLASGCALVCVATLASACTKTPEETFPEAEASPTVSPQTTVRRTEPIRPGPAARLGLMTGWGPTQTELDEAARAATRLSLPELAGQVIVASYAGTAAPMDLVNELNLGGVIVFADNISSTEQIQEVNADLVSAAQRPWPLFLSVDQEGGIVERVQGDVTRFPAFMSAGAAGDPALTEAAAAASGAELRGLGFTVDFAPDADVTSGPDDPTIGSRSAGSDPEVVAEQMTAAVKGYLSAGVVPVIKHFPGHGSVPADSHTSLPVQNRTRRDLDRVDLLPFERGVASGMPSVMVGHIDVQDVDPGEPSSMSGRVTTGILRRDLGFEGLVVTDSLQMAGVAATRDSAESAVQALLVGADVLLMPPDPVAARDGIVAAVESDRLPRRRVRQAAARQIAALLHGKALADALPGGAGAEPGSGAAASAALSAAAITQVAGPCGGRLVGDAVSPVGDTAAVATFTAAARAAGLPIAAGGDAVALIGYGGSPATADVAVALDAPYVLAGAQARYKIATYGDTPGAMRALVDVLTGAAPAPGTLPVRVKGVPRAGCPGE